MPEPRARADATLLWGLFGVGYLASYFLTTALPTPLPWYYPLEGRWALEVHPNGLAADFYGRVLASLLGGALVALLGRPLVRRAAEATRARWLTTVLAWSAGLLLFTAALYLYLLAGRIPFPAALPPGYEPR